MVKEDRHFRDTSRGAQAADPYDTDFFDGLSHELKTPINDISGVLELLLGTGLDAKQRSYIREILIRTEQLSSSINNIMDWLVQERGSLISNSEPVSISEIVREVIGRHFSPDRCLEEFYRIDVGLDASLSSDKAQLSKMLKALTDLVVGQGGCEPRIFVELEEENDDDKIVRITVEGLISAGGRKERNHSRPEMIFSDALKLAVATSYAERLSGRLLISETPAGQKSYEVTLQLKTIQDKRRHENPFSSYEQGSTLQVSTERSAAEALIANAVELIDADREKTAKTNTCAAPKAIEAVDTYHANERADMPSPQPNRSQTPDILYCEDNPINQLVMSEMLSASSFSFVMVNNGKEGLDFLAEQQPRVILMDVSMPVMNGLEATQKIREIERLRNMPARPIIGVTAHASAADQQKCIDAGMNDVLTKPVAFRLLTEKIESWMCQAEEKDGLRKVG